MNVFLINPPFYFARELEYLTQNLGLGYIAATLLEKGHRVEALDALAEGREIVERVSIGDQRASRYGLPFDEIAQKIPDDTDLIAITAPFSNHATIIDELAEAIRKGRPSVPIVLGGIYPSTQPERAFESSVDYVVVGEGESPMADLASGKDPADIPGVWYRRDGEIVENGRAEMVPDLDSIPFPARQLLPMEKYLTLSPRGTPGRRIATIITSRGCPFDCTFCSIHPVYTRKWRPRSAENVLAEIDVLVENYGVDFIEFEDDNLTMARDRAMAIFEGLAERPVEWGCANGLRVDTLDEEMLALIKKSGCEAIHLAIESGDPDMLRAMKKKLDLDKVIEVTKTCRRLGIRFVAFFIIGHPGETEQRFRNTLDFAARLKELGMVSCGIHLATPYPGTELFRMAKEKGYLIHENVEKRIMLPGDIHIETPDFDRKTVLMRFHRFRLATGMEPDFTGGFYGFMAWKMYPWLSDMGLHARTFLTQIPENKRENFHEPEKTIDGMTYCWSAGDSGLDVVVPPKLKCLKLFATSNRNHTIEVFLDEIKLGEAKLDGIWREYYLWPKDDSPSGSARLTFKSDTFSIADLGDEGDERKLGFMLGWYEFEARDTFIQRIISLNRKKLLAKTPDWLLDGFLAPQMEEEGVPYRWSSSESTVIVRAPGMAKSIKLLARSNRDHAVKIWLDNLFLGEIRMRDGWVEYGIPLPADHPSGSSRLKFESDTLDAKEFGIYEDERRLAFVLSSWEFSFFKAAEITQKPFYP